MLRTRLSNPFQNTWYTCNEVSVLGKAWDKKSGWLTAGQLAEYFMPVETPAGFSGALSGLEGHFSVVINKPGFQAFANDKIRSFPLLYTLKEKEWVVTDNVDLPLVRHLPFKRSAETGFIHYWCAQGNDTLKEGLFQLQAGQMAFIRNGNVETAFYYDPAVQNKQNTDISLDTYPDLAFFEKWYDLIKDREVWVPLSGGYDSRAILILLKIFGHRNINAFTYGAAGAFEEAAAREVAKKLHVNWQFVEYTPATFDLFFSGEWAEYAGKSHLYCSLPHEQDFFAVYALKDKISPGSYIIPGHYGDNLNGSRHIKPGAAERDVYREIAGIYNLPREQVREHVRDYYLPSGNRFYLNWYFKNHASKYILNSVKIYEHFGYEWIIPFSDSGWMDHWLSTSEEGKINHRFYHIFLNEKLFNGFNVSISLKRTGLFNRIKPLVRLFVPPFIMQIYKKNHFKKDVNNLNILYDRIYEALNDPAADRDYVINRLFARYFLKNIGFYHEPSGDGRKDIFL